jgi:predicted PurR-regulated permease PerM
MAGFGWFLAAQVIAQFEQLGSGLAEAWRRLQDYITQFGWGRVAMDQLTEGAVPKNGPDIVARIFGGLVSGLSALVVSVFLGLYLAVNPRLYERGVLRLLPFSVRGRAADILGKMGVALRGWLLGTLFNMMVVGTVTTLGLWLLGIPMALALGIVAFFLEFIPYLGPILAAVPALLIASSVGSTEVLYTALLYWGLQSAESYLLSPLVYQRSVDLPPALTVGAQIIIGTLFGVLGIVFATPLSACALVLIQEAYVEDTLGDPVQSEPERRPG